MQQSNSFCIWIVFEENSVREITDYCDVIVLEWLRFQIAFCKHEKTKVGVFKVIPLK